MLVNKVVINLNVLSVFIKANVVSNVNSTFIVLIERGGLTNMHGHINMQPTKRSASGTISAVV